MDIIFNFSVRYRYSVFIIWFQLFFVFVSDHCEKIQAGGESSNENNARKNTSNRWIRHTVTSSNISTGLYLVILYATIYYILALILFASRS